MGSVNDLEEEEYLASQGFLQADWGVNVLELQRACQTDYENYCPDSVPRVFYEDEIPRYPPADIPHDGLAPVKDDAPCWMKCAATHESELTYECDVASQRMYNWLKEHDGDLEYMESPQLMMFGALIHFLLLLLILLTCIRCTRVFVENVVRSVVVQLSCKRSFPLSRPLRFRFLLLASLPCPACAPPTNSHVPRHRGFRSWLVHHSRPHQYEGVR